MISSQYESQHKVEPAVIISRYESLEEQSLVAGIFNKEIRALTGDVEQQKAINEVVRNIKKYSLDYRSRHVTDMAQLQQLISEKKQLQTLQVPF